MSSVVVQHRGWVATIRLFVRPPRTGAQHCELCGAPIPSDHPHLATSMSRQLLCCCAACAVLLGDSDRQKYRRVPERCQRLVAFQMTDVQWDSLLIPVGIAFFFKSTADGRMVALYPGPAGLTESPLDLTAWDELVAANPVLAEFEPDVEALLVNRLATAHEYLRVPIDQCYALAGLIRATWRGLSGGGDVRGAIQDFFSRLRADGVEGHTHA